jgi:hypothetical protein
MKNIKRLKKWQKPGPFFLNLKNLQYFSFFQLHYITLYPGMMFQQEHYNSTAIWALSFSKNVYFVCHCLIFYSIKKKTIFVAINKKLLFNEI